MGDKLSVMESSLVIYISLDKKADVRSGTPRRNICLWCNYIIRDSIWDTYACYDTWPICETILSNAEKVTLYKAVILFNSVHFRNGNFSKRKEFAPTGSELFPLWAVPYGMENHFYPIRWPWLLLFLLRKYVTCVMGATPMFSVVN